MTAIKWYVGLAIKDGGAVDGLDALRRARARYLASLVSS